jgi:threonine-phosphate decarboxylase
MTENHRHGGNPGEDLSRFKLPGREIIDFSVNLNPLGIPDLIRSNWNDLIKKVKDYPSVNGNGIVRFFNKKTGVPESEILAGNGSTELIYLIPRTLAFKNVLILAPSFHDYERASILAGASVKRLELKPEDGFIMPSIGSFEKKMADVDAVWLGRPNNPTATLLPKNIILDLAEQYPETYFIIDEAFIQFVDNWKEESLILNTGHSNILVIQSLTKFYAVAGLRAGGIIGREDVINNLRENKEPWSVNGIAEKVAYLLMDCDEYEKNTAVYIQRERERIYNKLEKIKDIDPFISCANFFLCRWNRTDNLDDLIVYLLKNGVYIRDCRNFAGLENNFFRFGMRSIEENNLLLSLLSSFPDA